MVDKSCLWCLDSKETFVNYFDSDKAKEIKLKGKEKNVRVEGFIINGINVWYGHHD